MADNQTIALPQEIIDKIIDEVAGMTYFEVYHLDVYHTLHRNNEVIVPDLYSCALTARSFVPRTHKHIFRQIMLYPENACPLPFRPSTFRPTPQRFLAYVASSTAVHVKSVILHGEAPDFGAGETKSTNLGEWVSGDPNLRRIFSSLPSFQALYLRNLRVCPIHFPPLQTLFTQMHIETVTLSSVTLEDGQDFRQVLGLFPFASSVLMSESSSEIDDCHWSNVVFSTSPQSSDATDETPFIHLRRLGLVDPSRSESSGLMDHTWLVRRIPCLNFSYANAASDDCLYHLGELLESMPCLVELGLDLTGYMRWVSQPPTPDISLSLPFRKLEVLKLMMLATTRNHFGRSLPRMEVPLLWDLYIRSLISSQEECRLKKLEIQLDFNRCHNVSLTGNWLDLPRALISLPNLSNVKLILVNEEANQLQGASECVQFYAKLRDCLQDEGNPYHDLLYHTEVDIRLENCASASDGAAQFFTFPRRAI